MEQGRRFSIIERLGAGAMGVVYRARDQERGVEVALKRLELSDQASVARFKREFRVLADVSHPNLVQLYELIAADEQLFFTMELVHGVDFLEWVRPRPGDGAAAATTSELPPRWSAPARPALEPAPPSRRVVLGEVEIGRLRDALGQLAIAVAAIHDAGILHRDLKPSNVLVDEAGRVVLLDFGIAADQSPGVTLTATVDRVVGTPHYMAPEQAAGHPATSASDWYAFGAMLYAALTGEPPHTGTRREVMNDKQAVEVTVPAGATGGALELAELAIALLQIDPEHRPDRTAVLRALGVARGSARSRVRANVPLIGREPELAALELAVGEARSGRATIALVSGRTGMGKSALLRALVDRLREERAAVLLGRCYQHESVPFKALDSLADALATWLRRRPPKQLAGLVPQHAWALSLLFPVLRRVDGFDGTDAVGLQVDATEARRRGVAALRELLHGIAGRHTPVLVIDDLQWGDRDSAEILAELVRAPNAPPILLVASYRAEDAESSGFLPELLARSRELGVELRHVEVGPLGDAAARELAALHLGARADPSLAQRIAAESEGSPLSAATLARRARPPTGAEPDE